MNYMNDSSPLSQEDSQVIYKDIRQQYKDYQKQTKVEKKKLNEFYKKDSKVKLQLRQK